MIGPDPKSWFWGVLHLAGALGGSGGGGMRAMEQLFQFRRMAWARSGAGALTLCALAVSVPQPSSAQVNIDPFIATWTDFLETCAPVLADPVQTMTEPNVQPGYELVGMFRNPAGSDIQIDQFNLDFDRYLGIVLTQVESRYTLLCEATFYGFDIGAVEAFATAVTDMIEATPDLSITGGAVEVLPVTNVDLGDLIGGSLHSFVIAGAFTEFPFVNTQLHLNDAGIAISLRASWEQPE